MIKNANKFKNAYIENHKGTRWKNSARLKFRHILRQAALHIPSIRQILNNRDEYLKEKYGGQNVKTMNVMGAPVRLINDGQGWFPVDRYDMTSKDFIDVLGEVGPMIGSIAGGIGGAGLSKTPAGTAIGSAAGYAAAGTLQDSLVKAVMGAGEGFGNSIMRRSTEAMIGLPIEYGVTKIGGALLRDVATMRKGAVSGLRWPLWTTAVWESPPSRWASPPLHSRIACATPATASSLASRSWSIRRWPSSSRTWTPKSTPPEP